MKLPEFGAKRPIATIMFFFSILILGGLSLALLGIDLMPKIDPAAVSIITAYRGAGAQDVEKKISEVIEKGVSTTPNVKKVTSISKEGISVVTVQFEYGTNMDTAVSDIRGAIDFIIKELPDDVERPSIFKFDTAMMPILFLSVSAKQNANDMRTIIDDKIVRPLQRIPGVGSVMMRGGPERKIKILFDRDKLNDLHLNIYQIASIIAAQNQDIPAGSIENDRRNYVLRVPGEIKDSAEFGKIVVANKNGKVIYLKDVADIKDGYYEDDREITVNGRRGMVIMLQKQSDANTVKVIDAVKKKLPELTKRLPKDMKVKAVFDSGKFIKDSIKNLSTTIIWGGILVILTVLLFLRNIRSSLIISVIIPFSLITAFILMYVAGYTINIISLSALAVAIGMVVDNGIVVLENITKHIEKGETGKEASMYGASEVGGAILASTLTTIVIFVPIFFINDISTIMFKQLGFSIMIVLVGSLITALMLIPMLASKYLKKTSSKSKLAEVGERVFSKIENVYRKTVAWAIEHRKTVVWSAIFIFLLSIVSLKLFVGTEFMPQTDSGSIEIYAYLPQGASIDKTKEVAKKMREIVVKDVPEIKDKFTISGVSEGGMATVFGSAEGINIVRLEIQLVDKEKRERSDKEVAEILRKDLMHIKGIEKLTVKAADMFSRILSGGSSSPIQVNVYGYDIDKAYKFAKKIKDEISKINGIRNADISMELGKPQIEVHMKRDKLYNLGLSVAQVANELRAQYSGFVATKYRVGGDEYDVELKLNDYLRKDVEALKGTSILTPFGKKVPLLSIADIKLGRGPVEIKRERQSRVIYVTADTYGRSFGQIATDLKDVVNKIKRPNGIDVEISGQAKDQKTSFFYLILAVLGGIVLVYMVMAAQFESLRDPFIILFSIPFAFSGVFFILALTGINLSIIVFIGLIMLVGIVVNNAIVLIDYINLLRAREYKLKDAILNAAQSRMRPVLMTAFTTIFGMLPLALSRGEGSESWVPLGVSVIGGLFFSTFVTLILIPAIYMSFERKKALKKGELE